MRLNAASIPKSLSDRRFRTLSRALWLRRAPAATTSSVIHAPTHDRRAPATRHFRR